ncbi:MAG TPA: M56 family metallopeptidase [Verrucomicrobiae bacterium]|nr:M56 family metallopeptidase [Verrucomicrobiae bacterium]
MFYALAVALCLAVLFLVLVSTSLLCMTGLRLLLKLAHPTASGAKANLLFIARLLPLALACIVTFGLALPAFLQFEPYSTEEGMGFRLMALAALGALVLVGMVWRGASLLRGTRDAQRTWRQHSQKLHVEGLRVPVYCVENGGPLMAVTGIFRPTIFVASGIVRMLSPKELHAALSHEMAHISSFDNLKQLLLKITRAPHWLKALYAVDVEWMNASEIAADQDALAEGASLLDLSSALIKVGRLNRSLPARRALASHLVPAACGSALESRVTRLSELLEGKSTAPVPGTKRGNLALPVVIALATYVACIHALLPAVHEALEFLVR